MKGYEEFRVDAAEAEGWGWAPKSHTEAEFALKKVIGYISSYIRKKIP